MGTVMLCVTERPFQASGTHLCVLRKADMAKERREFLPIGRAGAHLSKI